MSGVQLKRADELAPNPVHPLFECHLFVRISGHFFGRFVAFDFQTAVIPEELLGVRHQYAT